MKHSLGPITMLLLCLLWTGSAIARPQAGRGQRPGGEMQPPAPPDSSQVVRMVEELAESISLSDTQQADIAALHLAHFAEVEALTAKGRPSRKEMDALRGEFEAEVKALLDEDQIAGFEEFVSRRRPQRPQGRPGR